MKKAQITVFIILGVIILLSAGLFLLVKENTTIFRPDSIAGVPDDMVPIKRLVESCMETLGDNAVRQMAMHGGYIDLPLKIDANPLAHVSLFPSSPFKVPLWYYNGENRMPSKRQMESELSDYIDSSIVECATNFDSFRDRFEIKYKSIPKSNVTIADAAVNIKTEYSLEVSNLGTGDKTTLEDYFVSIPINLGKLYRLAAAIMQHENDEAFLERLTMNIVAGSGFPYEGMEINCNEKKWNINSEIRPNLIEMLKYNLHFIGFENTNIIDSGYDFYNNMYRITVTDDDFRDVRVITDLSFNDNFADRLRMQIYPSGKVFVEPMKHKLPLLGECLKVYHHFWDLNYPLLFTLIDETGFTFNFGTPVMIDNNLPVRKKSIYFQSEEQLEIVDSDYCESQPRYPLKINLQDYADAHNVVSNATIRFRCVKYLCNMGKAKPPTYEGTTIPIYGAEPILEAEFPYCINGLLVANAPGYLESYAFADTYPEMETNEHTVQLRPVKDFVFDFLVKEYPAGNTRALRDDEVVVINIKNDEAAFEKMVVFKNSTHNENLTLPLGTYTNLLSLTLVKDDMMLGGLELEEWKTDYNNLKVSNKITFKLLSKSDPIQTINDTIDLWQNIIIGKSNENLPVIT